MEEKLLKVICTISIFIFVMIKCKKNIDAASYVKGFLDSTLKGEHEEYAEHCKVETSELEKYYNEYIDIISMSWTTGLIIEDDIKEKFRQLAADILKSTKYNVKEARRVGDNYIVQVATEPLVLEISVEEARKIENNAAVEYIANHKEINAIEFYTTLAEQLYDYLAEMKEDVKFEAEKIVEVTIVLNSDNEYSISSAERKKLFRTIMKPFDGTKCVVR